MRTGAGLGSGGPPNTRSEDHHGKTLNRPAVDIAPRAHPGLALVLALLAVPGSTLAWDLPAGGLWIGLPLAVAAIVLGVVARRRSAAPSWRSPRSSSAAS